MIIRHISVRITFTMEQSHVQEVACLLLLVRAVLTVLMVVRLIHSFRVYVHAHLQAQQTCFKCTRRTFRLLSLIPVWVLLVGNVPVLLALLAMECTYLVLAISHVLTLQLIRCRFIFLHAHPLFY